MDAFFALLSAINAVLLSVPVLLTLLGVGILFTVWSGFCQYRSLTHGVRLISGRGPHRGEGTGVLSHFQALSAALSATVGLGNIGGVAIAVSLGGPGAVFWMWMVGLAGMAIKTAEVTLSMLYRDTTQPDHPLGGPMMVARQGLSRLPGMARLGAVIGALFCLPLILFGITGGNMFQAWNVAEISRAYFGVPPWISGLGMALLVAAVILGGIRRIGRITGTLVPVMCGLYMLAAIAVLVVEREQLPALFRLIFTAAFQPAEAAGAFLGAATGTAFIFGMKRALFSSEAGLGSAPIAHAAVKTREPVTEGVVAGLEPFIDTLVVCTLTALVILVSGVWNRGAEAHWLTPPQLVAQSDGRWVPDRVQLPEQQSTLKTGDPVFLVVRDQDQPRQRLFGEVTDNGGIAGNQAVTATSDAVLNASGDISGNGTIEADSPGLLFITDQDLHFTGGKDQVGAEAQVLVREQVFLAGNVSLRGSVVIEDAADVSSLVTSNRIGDNASITNNGTLGGTSFGVGSWRVL